VVAIAVLGLAVLAVPLAAQQGGILDTAQDFYRATTRAWLAPMAVLGRRLFAALAAIEITLSGLYYVLRREALDEMAGRFLLKFVLLSFVLLLITSAGVWLRPIVTSLAAAGRVAGVLPVPVGPSEVVDVGTRIAFSTLDVSALPFAWSSLATMLSFLVSRFVVLGAFLWVATELVATWVTSYVALAIGPFILGFGGLRVTAPFAEHYLNYLVYLGFKLFLIYLLLAAGMTIVGTYIPPTLKVTTAREMGDVLAISVIFARLVYRVPSAMASRVTGGGGTFGLAHALRTL
jgi:type IV secretion system protein TrbL